MSVVKYIQYAYLLDRAQLVDHWMGKVNEPIPKQKAKNETVSIKAHQIMRREQIKHAIFYIEDLELYLTRMKGELKAQLLSEE